MEILTEKEAWENLANAIILRAIKDYKLEERKKAQLCNRVISEGEQDLILKFIHSGFFVSITDLKVGVMEDILKNINCIRIDDKFLDGEGKDEEGLGNIREKCIL